MSTKAVLTFIDTVIQHYPPFRWDEEQEKAWVNIMVRELGGFSEAVLERAIKEMIRTRKDRRIPIVPECLSACHDARRWIDAEKNKAQLPMGVKPAASHDWDARTKLAMDLCKTPQGRQAAQEGWIQQLYDYCRKKGAAPTAPAEIAELKREAKLFDEAYARCVKGGWPYAAGLEKLGAKILKSREDLVDRVLHGVVG